MRCITIAKAVLSMLNQSKAMKNKFIPIPRRTAATKHFAESNSNEVLWMDSSEKWYSGHQSFLVDQQDEMFSAALRFSFSVWFLKRKKHLIMDYHTLKKMWTPDNGSIHSEKDMLNDPISK